MTLKTSLKTNIKATIRSTNKKARSRKPTVRKKKPKVIEHPRSSAAEFINREIGWLNFNQRVLHEAIDQRNPLLERLKFLNISCSNLDEFFMKRVGGLKRQVAFQVTAKSCDGKTAKEQLDLIRNHVQSMLKSQAECYRNILKPELAKNKIHLESWASLKAKDKEFIKNYYFRNVFPILTPLSVDPGHPFPFISNLSISLAVTLKHPERDEKLFARIKVPKVLPQWIRVETDNNEEFKFISLIEIIKNNLSELFPSMQVLQVMPFRITRNAESEHDEEDTEDLLQMIEEELRQRRFAEVVRLEHGPNPDPEILKFLMEELELAESDVYELATEFDYFDLNQICEVPKSTLKFDSFHPVIPVAFQDESASIFDIIKKQDQLLHHPYDSFSATVEKFIKAASEDPKVLAIKMTLYRTGDNSPFIKALIKAAERGKQVVCLVELKARFDEERNIYWAQELESAGVHVVYGVVGLKTHAKTALVVRQEHEGIKCYAHIGTGNYNVQTARFYTDMGLLTADDRITKELVELFHFLTGRSLKQDYQHLLIAPVNMFSKFKSMIEREAEWAQKGKPAQIIAKFNNMEENDIALSLYAASQKGVEIDLIIRGFCCLKPGLAKMSEKIRVTSTIGRFLEHSRIFYFRNGAADPIDGDFFIGSADWMYRNLHARVETITPIYDRYLKAKCWEALQMYLQDKRQTWEMHTDGSYKQRNSEQQGVQQSLVQLTRQRSVVIEEVK